MNIFKKIAVVGLSLGLAIPTFAASISNPLFSNGQTTIDATGNATVNGTFTLTVGTNEVVEYLRATPDTYPFTDTSVGGTLGYQEGVYTNVPFTVKVPPNTGTYNVNEQGAGIYGGNRSINGGDNVVFGPTSVGMVRVVAIGGDTSGSSSSSFDQLSAAIAALIAALKPATAPAPSAVCTEVNTKLVGTQDNVYNDANVRLQGFLLSEGMQIPALKAGAAFGYKSTQTNAALSQFMMINSCH